MHNFIVSGNSIKTIFDVKALETVHEMMQHFIDMQIQLSGCKIIAQLAMGKNNLTSTFYISRNLCQLIVLTTYKYRHDKIDSRSSLFSFVRTWVQLPIQTSKFNDKYTFEEFILRCYSMIVLHPHTRSYTITWVIVSSTERRNHLSFHFAFSFTMSLNICLFQRTLWTC